MGKRQMSSVPPTSHSTTSSLCAAFPSLDKNRPFCPDSPSTATGSRQASSAPGTKEQEGRQALGGQAGRHLDARRDRSPLSMACRYRASSSSRAVCSRAAVWALLMLAPRMLLLLLLGESSVAAAAAPPPAESPPPMLRGRLEGRTMVVTGGRAVTGYGIEGGGFRHARWGHDTAATARTGRHMYS